MRHEREQKLVATDFYFKISDYPLEETLKENLKAYRQSLRDLPQNIANGTIPAPEVDENGLLIWDHWPIPPTGYEHLA